MTDFSELQQKLCKRVSSSDEPQVVLRASELRELYQQIKTVEPDKRAEFGQSVNALKLAVEQAVQSRQDELAQVDRTPIDVTAPMDINAPIPKLLPSSQGSTHPLMQEIELISDIFNRMGYVTEESREIDDQYHMFDTLNFPPDHPARDDYDTFMTVETDKNNESFIAPAHTSTMQNRLLRKYAGNLENDGTIAFVVPDRVFRNEDLDARHEHTFYQVEGVYVAKNVTVGNLISTLQAFLQEYYSQELDVKVNPFYFPFTEPSFEFSLSCPFCRGEDMNCKVCSGEGWVELLGCGLIHPNVMRQAGIDPETYTGFAFGCGVDRLVMMKHSVEDVRHFHSAKLDFLRQF